MDKPEYCVQVQDPQRRPIRGVEIGMEGVGGSTLIGDDGKALAPLGTQAAENDWISLQIFSPPGEDLVMVSPWDYRALVPSFKSKPENFVRVVVVQRGDRTALENSAFVAALASWPWTQFSVFGFPPVEPSRSIWFLCTFLEYRHLSYMT